MPVLTSRTPARPVPRRGSRSGRSHRAVAALTAGLAGVAALTGCSSEPAPPAQPAPAPATTATSPRPAPAPKPAPKPAPTHPLTGKPGTPRGPVLAVKIDNTGPARPQIGLEAADVVYVEPVEAGLTRLVAVYASRYPRRVGPVRSVRNSDPELLSAYGRAGLVFSGGAGGPLRTLHRSALRDLAGQAGYSRDGSRSAPYNLIADLGRMARSVRAVARPRDVGFRWADRDPRLDRARHTLRMSAVVGQVTVSFGFDPRSHRWVQTIGGRHVRTASGARVTTPNVIVQRCRITVDRGDVDVNGVPSVLPHTVGSGPVTIFRDGRVITGRWVRPKAGAPTRYVDAAGKDIQLRTGGAWVLIAATGTRVRIG